MARRAAAAAQAVPPVLAHVTARLDVLLGWERVCHLQLPAVPHPAGDNRAQGDPEASSPPWFPSVPSHAPGCAHVLCPWLLPNSPCILAFIHAGSLSGFLSHKFSFSPAVTTQSCFQPIPGRTLHSKAQVS